MAKFSVYLSITGDPMNNTLSPGHLGRVINAKEMSLAGRGNVEAGDQKLDPVRQFQRVCAAIV